MNKTKIEYVDYTINPIKGLCRNNCWYCYAKRMYLRFNWNTDIRLNTYEFSNLPKKPSKIFVGSMHDIFGDWIPYHWIIEIVECCLKFPQHIFLFLTKNPERYREFEFPQNCWLGTTIESSKQLKRIFDLAEAIGGRNKTFISIEPLLDNLQDLNGCMPVSSLDWIIVGGLTPKSVHKDEWVEEIIKVARIVNIPIFLKGNLKYKEVIQEYPK